MASAVKCFGSFWVDDIACTIINGAALLIVVCIGLMGHFEFQIHGHVHNGQKLFFYSAILSSVVSSTGAVGQNVLCMLLGLGTEWIMVLCSLMGYVSLLMCILGVFMLRLIDTFRGSTFELSTMKHRTLQWLYMTMVTMWILVMIMFFYVVFAQNNYTEDSFVIPPWSLCTLFMALLILVVLSIWTVYEFCHRLLMTAKTLSQWTSTQSKGLNQNQIAIINVSAKYISLFMFAMITMFINFGIFSLCTYNHYDPAITLGFECISNVLCLYLQFPFAATCYYRCCGRLDVCCRWIITWRLGKHDETIKAKRAMMMNVSSTLNTSSTGSGSAGVATKGIKNEKHLTHAADSYVEETGQRTIGSIEGIDGLIEVTITSFSNSTERIAVTASSENQSQTKWGGKSKPVTIEYTTSDLAVFNETSSQIPSTEIKQSIGDVNKSKAMESTQVKDEESTWNLSNSEKSKPTMTTAGSKCIPWESTRL